MRRVAVTGIGIVAPGGNNTVDAWQAAVAGKSAIGRISAFDATALPVQIAAEVKGFDPLTYLDAKQARQSSRFIQLAIGAAQQAAQDSQLDVAHDADRCGCALGVGLGAIGNIEEEAGVLRDRGPRKVSPLLLPYAIPNMAAGLISISLGLEGPNFCTATACASGAHAMVEALMHIKLGTADVMLAGGSEAVISPLCVSAFARMRALSTRNESPAEASRPFDRDRDGFVMGEGAAVLVLEDWERARRRGARIYAEVAGFGVSADAFHITTPHPEGHGAARAMSGALRSAGIAAEEVDYINAHGTSTSVNDAAESGAIEMVFGEASRALSVSSTKGVTGHCLGAAGAIEAAFTVLSVEQGVVPPTANYTTPDPACRLDYTPGEARRRNIRYALSNSFGFGGQNACLAFKQCS